MSINHKAIKADRLKLKTFTLNDASRITPLLQDKEIASTTITIPYPYHEKSAIDWVNANEKGLKNGDNIVWAICLLENLELVGAVNLSVNKVHNSAELGYWVGKRYWNKGYCSEAADAVISFGFKNMSLNKIVAYHMSRNPASGKVMQKIGMTHEGSFKKHYYKWGQYEDVEAYGVLASEKKFA